MILVDSSVWIDFFNGQASRPAGLLEHHLRTDLIIIADLILTEILQGFRRDSDFEAARTALLRLPCYTIGGRRIALAAARNYRQMRAAGITPRKTIDVLIATFCIENDIRLLHNDRDFDAIVAPLGLAVV